MADESLVESETSFGSFSHLLDARVLRALADMGFAHPTLIQAKSIPLALENRDILARARTGSGKTAAYCVPLVQKILNVKSAVGATLPAHLISWGLTAEVVFDRVQAMTLGLRGDLFLYLRRSLLNKSCNISNN